MGLVYVSLLKQPLIILNAILSTNNKENILAR